MAEIEYTVTGAEELDQVEYQWQKLNKHHGELSEHFAASYAKNTFQRRKQELLDKSVGGEIRIDIARDKDSRKMIGYCVSTISKQNKGEIDSIYIEDNYRRMGIGDCLMKAALGWMDEKEVKRRVVEVIVNNDEALTFYKQYDFYPRSIILQQVEDA